MSSLPLRLQMITMQTVAMAIAMTAHPTVTVVRIAIKGTSESPEFDHFEPNLYNHNVIKQNVEKRHLFIFQMRYRIIGVLLTVYIFTYALWQFERGPTTGRMAFQCCNAFDVIARMTLISYF